MQSEEEIGSGENMPDTNFSVEDVGENLEAGSGMQLDMAIPAEGDADMSGLGSPSSPTKRKRHGRFPASGFRIESLAHRDNEEEAGDDVVSTDEEEYASQENMGESHRLHAPPPPPVPSSATTAAVSSSGITAHSSGEPDRVGWLHKKTSRSRNRFTRRYFALWGRRSLYYFRSEAESGTFFSADARTGDASARGVINLLAVGSVRVSQRRNLPGANMGLELHCPDRVWLLCAPSEAEFAGWLRDLSTIVGGNLRRLHGLTGDDELMKEVSQVDLGRLSDHARSLLARGASDGAVDDLVNRETASGGHISTPQASNEKGEASLLLSHVDSESDVMPGSLRDMLSAEERGSVRIANGAAGACESATHSCRPCARRTAWPRSPRRRPSSPPSRPSARGGPIRLCCRCFRRRPGSSPRRRGRPRASSLHQ